MGKLATSPRSVELWSTIYAKAISPKSVTVRSNTVGFALTPAQAAELAAMLLAVAYDRNSHGDIFVTGKKSDNSVTVIRRNNGEYAPLGRTTKRGNK